MISNVPERLLAQGLASLGAKVNAGPVFDTLTVGNVTAGRVHAAAAAKKINLRRIDSYTIGLSLDETTTLADVHELLALFGDTATLDAPLATLEFQLTTVGLQLAEFPAPHARSTAHLLRRNDDDINAEYALSHPRPP